jgi:hypothetical protein
MHIPQIHVTGTGVGNNRGGGLVAARRLAGWDIMNFSPGVTGFISGFCPSKKMIAFSFLQILPHGLSAIGLGLSLLLWDLRIPLSPRISCRAH